MASRKTAANSTNVRQVADAYINLTVSLVDDKGVEHSIKAPVWSLTKGSSKTIDAILANPQKAKERIKVEIRDIYVVEEQPDLPF